MPATLEPGLLKLLEDSENDLRKLIADQDFDDDEEYSTAVSSVYENLDTFIKNFFVQVFTNGFGFPVNGVNRSTLLALESRFAQSTGAPRGLIDAYRECVVMKMDMKQDVYSGPHEFITDAYCNFLPRLFHSFREECEDRVTNYSEVIERITLLRATIVKVCTVTEDS